MSFQSADDDDYLFTYSMSSETVLRPAVVRPIIPSASSTTATTASPLNSITLTLLNHNATNSEAFTADLFVDDAAVSSITAADIVGTVYDENNNETHLLNSPEFPDFVRRCLESSRVVVKSAPMGRCMEQPAFETLVYDSIAPGPWAIALVVAHIFVFLIGLIGNVLVFLAIKRHRSMRTVINHYIVNLAIADFFVLIVCLPPSVIWDVLQSWLFGNITCKVVLYLQFVCVTVSILTLTTISVDRWLAIVRPLQFRRSRRKARCVIIVIWTISCLVNFPVALIYQSEENAQIIGNTTPFLNYCAPSLWSAFANTIFDCVWIILFYVLPLLAMTIAYTWMACVLWRSPTSTKCAGLIMGYNSAGAPSKPGSDGAVTIMSNGHRHRRRVNSEILARTSSRYEDDNKRGGDTLNAATLLHSSLSPNQSQRADETSQRRHQSVPVLFNVAPLSTTAVPLQQETNFENSVAYLSPRKATVCKIRKRPKETDKESRQGMLKRLLLMQQSAAANVTALPACLDNSKRKTETLESKNCRQNVSDGSDSTVSSQYRLPSKEKSQQIPSSETSPLSPLSPGYLYAIHYYTEKSRCGKESGNNIAAGLAIRSKAIKTEIVAQDNTHVCATKVLPNKFDFSDRALSNTRNEVTQLKNQKPIAVNHNCNHRDDDEDDAAAREEADAEGSSPDTAVVLANAADDITTANNAMTSDFFDTTTQVEDEICKQKQHAVVDKSNKISTNSSENVTNRSTIINNALFPLSPLVKTSSSTPSTTGYLLHKTLNTGSRGSSPHILSAKTVATLSLLHNEHSPLISSSAAATYQGPLRYSKSCRAPIMRSNGTLAKSNTTQHTLSKLVAANSLRHHSATPSQTSRNNGAGALHSRSPMITLTPVLYTRNNPSAQSDRIKNALKAQWSSNSLLCTSTLADGKVDNNCISSEHSSPSASLRYLRERQSSTSASTSSAMPPPHQHLPPASQSQLERICGQKIYNVIYLVTHCHRRQVNNFRRTQYLSSGSARTSRSSAGGSSVTTTNKSRRRRYIFFRSWHIRHGRRRDLRSRGRPLAHMSRSNLSVATFGSDMTNASYATLPGFPQLAMQFQQQHSAATITTAVQQSPPQQPPPDDQRIQSRRNAAKMLIAVAALFAFCFLPVHLLTVLRNLFELPDNQFWSIFSLVSHWLCYAQSASNPIIYNIMNRHFRRAFREALCRGCPRAGRHTNANLRQRPKSSAFIPTRENSVIARAYSPTKTVNLNLQRPINEHRQQSLRNGGSQQVSPAHLSRNNGRIWDGYCVEAQKLEKLLPTQTGNSGMKTILHPTKFASRTKMVKEKINSIRCYDADGFRLRAACVCVRPDSRRTEVLLVSSSRGPDLWVVPGGGIEPDEDPPLAAVREVREEAGVSGEIVQLLGVFENEEKRHRTSVYLFIVRQELESWEDQMEVGRRRCWFAYDDAVAQLNRHKPVQISYLDAAVRRESFGSTSNNNSTNNHHDVDRALSPMTTTILTPRFHQPALLPVGAGDAPTYINDAVGCKPLTNNNASSSNKNTSTEKPS